MAKRLLKELDWANKKDEQISPTGMRAQLIDQEPPVIAEDVLCFIELLRTIEQQSSVASQVLHSAETAVLL